MFLCSFSFCGVSVFVSCVWVLLVVVLFLVTLHVLLFEFFCLRIVGDSLKVVCVCCVFVCLCSWFV